MTPKTFTIQVDVSEKEEDYWSMWDGAYEFFEKYQHGRFSHKWTWMGTYVPLRDSRGSWDIMGSLVELVGNWPLHVQRDTICHLLGERVGAVFHKSLYRKMESKDPTMEDLLAVEGIGKVTAERIMRALQARKI